MVLFRTVSWWYFYPQIDTQARVYSLCDNMYLVGRNVMNSGYITFDSGWYCEIHVCLIKDKLFQL